MTISAGALLGRYEIHSPLGKGGMGEVYLAQGMNLGRRVALKLLPSEFTKDESRVRRFQQEARAASSVAVFERRAALRQPARRPTLCRPRAEGRAPAVIPNPHELTFNRGQSSHQLGCPEK